MSGKSGISDHDSWEDLGDATGLDGWDLLMYYFFEMVNLT